MGIIPQNSVLAAWYADLALTIDSLLMRVYLTAILQNIRESCPYNIPEHHRLHLTHYIHLLVLIQTKRLYIDI